MKKKRISYVIKKFVNIWYGGLVRKVRLRTRRYRCWNEMTGSVASFLDWHKVRQLQISQRFHIEERLKKKTHTSLDDVWFIQWKERFEHVEVEESTDNADDGCFCGSSSDC